MVNDDTFGNPSGAARRTRRRVASDQVAVPSACGMGVRAASRRMRSRTGVSSVVGWPPPCRGSSAANPSRLNRATRFGDGVPALAARRSGGPLVVGPACNHQEHNGVGEANGSCGVRPIQASQVVILLTSERAKRIITAAGHGTPGRVSYPNMVVEGLVLAMSEASDPLSTQPVSVVTSNDQSSRQKSNRKYWLWRIGKLPTDPCCVLGVGSRCSTRKYGAVTEAIGPALPRDGPKVSPSRSAPCGPQWGTGC